MKRLILSSRCMQAGIVGVAVAGIVTDQLTWVPAAVVSLFVTFIPAILKRNLNFVLPVELNFWIILALFLHVVGGFSNLYNDVPGWDHLTHVMSASLIGGLGFVLVVITDKYVESIYLPRPFLAFFIVMFVMAVGVLWEIMEYANDSLFHTQLQYGLSDTMFDLFFDGVAGFAVAAAGTQYLRRLTPDYFLESMHVEEARQKVKLFIEQHRGQKRT